MLLTVATILVAVYYGRPRSDGSPKKIVEGALHHWNISHSSGRNWMRQLPSSSESTLGLLQMVASTDASASRAAVEALHAMIDRRRACPLASDPEFVEQFSTALADVAIHPGLPVGAVDELAARLLSWSGDPEVDGQRVAADCAVAIQATGRERLEADE
jgi:hypothetical protein